MSKEPVTLKCEGHNQTRVAIPWFALKSILQIEKPHFKRFEIISSQSQKKMNPEGFVYAMLTAYKAKTTN